MKSVLRTAPLVLLCSPLLCFRTSCKSSKVRAAEDDQAAIERQRKPKSVGAAAVMAAMGHKSAKLALEVYARQMQRDRDTAQRMEALVWAQMGTTAEPTFEGVVLRDTPKELEPAV